MASTKSPSSQGLFSRSPDRKGAHPQIVNGKVVKTSTHKPLKGYPKAIG